MEGSVTFTMLPSFKIYSHRVTAASIEKVVANFTSFGDATKDQKVNSNFESGSPFWVANNLNQLNTEIGELFVDYFNARLQPFGSFTKALQAIYNYNFTQPCTT